MNEYTVVFDTGGWNRFKANTDVEAKEIARIKASKKEGRTVSRIELLDEIGRPVKEIEVGDEKAN